jgi:hypothetical protein
MFSMLGLASTPGCSGAAAPTLGPIPLESEAQMHEFLVSATFASVGDRSDSWTFHKDGTFEATLAGQVLQGEWAASKTTLELTGLRPVNAVGSVADLPERTLQLGWQDGKLNINIDGKQYRKY